LTFLYWLSNKTNFSGLAVFAKIVTFYNVFFMFSIYKIIALTALV